MTSREAGMREPKEGVTMSHASQAPFHGVGGYIYIYIYIFKGLTPVRLPPFLIREMGTQKAALAAMQHQMATPIFGSGTVIDRAVFNRGEVVGVCASVCVCVLVRVCGVGVRVRRVCL